MHIMNQRRPKHSASPTYRTIQDEGREVTLPGGRQVLLTRRHFMYGAAGVAAVAALGGVGVAVEMTSEEDTGISTLTVGDDATFTTEDCEYIEDANTAMVLTAYKELPYGTLVWASDDVYAVCLVPTEAAKPLTQVGMLSLTSGSFNILLTNAVGEDEGFEIYDVRGCSTGLVWAEADILDGVWRIYTATTDGASMGTPVLVEEGGIDWEMPMLACTANYAWWQILPRLDGEMKYENSLLKRARYGSGTVEEVYRSNGRMSTPPYSMDDSIVFVPRVDTSGTYYQLTRMNEAAEVVDALILPQSMRPYEAGYGKNGFSFAFDGIYNYGGGISNLGTYTPASPVPASGPDFTGALGADAYGKPAWFRFPRTPFASPAWCGNWFMVKSTTAVAGIDLENRRYFTLETKSGCDNYGDYLASMGMRKRIVTYTNIDHTSLEGETQTCCLVRVWEALS